VRPAWLLGTVLQTIAIAVAAWVIWRRGQPQRVVGVLLLGIGMILLAVNGLWLATGGLRGESSIRMRGGVAGFWLSILTALEILALGALALFIRRTR
jgi:hypothetical protein